MVTSDRGALARYFDAYAPDYLAKGYAATDDPAVYPVFRMRHDHILEMTAGLPPGNALDIGCGCWRMVADLAARGWRALGVDISPAMVREGAALLAREGVAADRASVREGSLEEDPFPEKPFDLVVAAGVIDSQRDDGPFLDTVRDLLRSGGHLALTVRNAGCLPLLPERIARRMLSVPLLSGAVRLSRRAGRALLGRPAPPPQGDSDRILQRAHALGAIRRTLARHGFSVAREGAFHFHLLPYPLEILLPRLHRRLGTRLEPRHAAAPPSLASGRILLARKR